MFPEFVISLFVLAYIPIFGVFGLDAFPNVMFPLLFTSVFSEIIPKSFSVDDPVIEPLLVNVPPPFANIPISPPVVPVLFTRFTFVLFVLFKTLYIIPIPLPVLLPEYLYSNVDDVGNVEFPVK